MKKVLSLICALLMVVTALPMTALSAEETPVEAAPIEATLPASATLVGTSACPPIDNQGGVGSCVSQAATYMQFTNAVARYMQAQGFTNWKPNDGSQYGNDNYIFSPKYTYNFAGAATIPVAEVLRTMGCATQNLSKFYKSGSASVYRVGGVWKTATTSWDVGEGIMQEALRYRLTGYEHYWTTDVAGGAITTSTEGRALIQEIKEAIVAGNVVLTGGTSGKWTYGNLTKAGNIAKSGEQVVYAAINNGGGGHQVSIVGYDDNCEIKVGGVTLKGAFLVANSWGQDWANHGYVWFSYDGINLESEYAAQCANLRSDDRAVSLDQFLITRWNEDIAYGYPDLSVTVEITTDDREKTTVELVRYDPASGESSYYLPKLFEYSGLHDSYDYSGYYNYQGFVAGAPCKGYFTFSYGELMNDIPANRTTGSYVWGVRVKVTEGYTATVGKITLKNASLATLASLDPEESLSGERKTYFAATANHIVGLSGDHYTLVAEPGYSSPVANGGSFSFRLVPAQGFTGRLATVKANGTALRAVNGIYTLSDVRELVVLTVEGVVQDVDNEPISVGVYNWEYYYDLPVLNLTFPTDKMPKEVYENGVGTPEYPYVFRLTDQSTGISYYVKPHSTYNFGGSILYRLPLAEAGMSVTEGTRYQLTVEVCYGGNALYVGSIDSNSQITVNGGSPKYVSYIAGGELIAKDAYLPGSATYLRPLPEGFYRWNADLPAFMGNSALTLTAQQGDGSHKITVQGDCTLVPLSGSVYPVPDGESLSFRLVAPDGCTTDLATVLCGGEKLVALDGVYTLSDIRSDLTVTVTGIVEDKNGAPMEVAMYNNAGWELYGGDYVMVIGISNEYLPREIYSLDSDLGNYPYDFRLTDNATGVSYYMEPQSFYHFSESTLYRLKIQPSGFTAVAGREYDFTVDLCYNGRALYTGRMTTTCGYSATVAPFGTPHYVYYKVNGSRVATDAFLEGSPVPAREVPAVTGKYGAWSPALPTAMGASDLTVNALYTAVTYPITFVVDGVSTTVFCEAGELPVFEGSTDKPNAGAVGYRFTGWDHEIVPAAGPATYLAQYEEVTARYTVTWVVAKGSFTEEVEYGTVPVFTGDTSKPSTATTLYTFAGWDKTIRAVTKNMTYTARYTETALQTYVVTWIVNGVRETESYPAGSIPTYKGATPSKAPSARYTYSFFGWTNGSMAYYFEDDLPAVTKNITYTAMFDEIPREELPGDMNGDGQLSIQDVTLLLSLIARSGSSAAADMNGDGQISIQDVTLLLVAIAK